MALNKNDYRPCGCCGQPVNTLTRNVVVRYTNNVAIYFHKHCYDNAKGARDVGAMLRVQQGNSHGT